MGFLCLRLIASRRLVLRLLLVNLAYDMVLLLSVPSIYHISFHRSRVKCESGR